MQSDCSNVTSPMSSTSCVSNNKICDKMQTDGCDDRQDHVNNVFDLLHVHDVPDHHKEISILTGYRQRLEYSDCMKSIFKLHNETINIWTHLLGFVFFFMLMMKDVLWRQEHIRDSADYSATVLQLITYQVPIIYNTTLNTVHCYQLFRPVCCPVPCSTQCLVMTADPHGRTWIKHPFCLLSMVPMSGSSSTISNVSHSTKSFISP